MGAPAAAPVFRRRERRDFDLRERGLDGEWTGAVLTLRDPDASGMSDRVSVVVGDPRVMRTVATLDASQMVALAWELLSRAAAIGRVG